MFDWQTLSYKGPSFEHSKFVLHFPLPVGPTPLSDQSLARTALLILLVACRGGVWTLEQPGSSVAEFHPTWTYLMAVHMKMCGITAVLSSEMESSRSTMTANYHHVILLKSQELVFSDVPFSTRLSELAGGCLAMAMVAQSANGHMQMPWRYLGWMWGGSE